MNKVQTTNEKTITHIDPNVFYDNNWCYFDKPKGKSKKPEMKYREDEIIEYFNDYLFFDNQNPSTLIELNDCYSEGYIIRKIKDIPSLYAPFYEFWKIWNNSPNRRTIRRRKYEPYLASRPIDADGEWNLFQGFKHKFDPNFKVDINKINIWLNLLKEVWANNDEVAYQYILKWFAHKIQFPANKIGVAIVLKSFLEGAGKNTFYEFFIKHVIGSQYGIVISNVEEVFRNFNAQFERTLLVLCDETGNKGSMYSNADKWKAWVTSTTQNIEQKNIDMRSNVPNYNDNILTSNNDWIAKIGANDRRHACFEASNKYVGNHAFWNEVQEYMNDDVGCHFFHYLALLDLSDYNPRQIPMTEWKRELKTASINPIISSVLKMIYNNTDVNGNIINTTDKWHVSEFYDIYKSLMENKNSYTDKKDENLSIALYSKRLSQVLNDKPIVNPFTKNNKRGRGYNISTQTMMDRIKAVLNDPDYSFAHVDDDLNAILESQL